MKAKAMEALVTGAKPILGTSTAFFPGSVASYKKLHPFFASASSLFGQGRNLPEEALDGAGLIPHVVPTCDVCVAAWRE